MAYPISLQMYTVRDLTKTPDDYRKVIRQIADIGYVGVEAGPPKDMSAGDFRKWVEDQGLVLSTTWGNPTAEGVGQLVERANTLGVKHVVASWPADKFKTPEEVGRTSDHFKQAAELLEPHGLAMLYHNHWWEFAHKVDGRAAWEVLFERAPGLGAELDLYWASNFGEVDVPALVRKYAARTEAFHIKDGPLAKGDPNTACGKGKMDLPACLNAADPDVLKWVVVELDNYVGGNENMMDAVRDSYAYLTGTGLVRGNK